MSEPIRVSIVIPVYNEEGILHASVVDLHERLAPLGLRYEIVLAENGSRDRTLEVARELAQKYAEVRFLSVGEPNYGRALRAGILDARGTLVICEEIDLCDVDFHRRALALLESDAADMVIGSKLIDGAADQRPLFRHATSIVYTTLLRVLLDFRGSDTHGLKAFRRDRVAPLVEACLTDKDVFASELVIRAYRAGIRVHEIPIRIVEMRPPSINLFKRVPNVLKNLGKLTWAVRLGGRSL
ncbi:MAG TPA: glycosyltransferase family 2 protein [Polyangiaceae bacterium]